MTAELMQRMVAQYGLRVLRKSALSIRGGAGVFERVLGTGGYKAALEIGTYRGVAAAALALFCERVTTIDLRHGRLERHGESFDRQAFWKELGVGNIELRLVEDDAEKAAVINATKFDFAFIDAGKDDIARDFALVRHCGTVLFHDYADRGQAALNVVYDFVNSLPKDQIEIMDIFALWRAA